MGAINSYANNQPVLGTDKFLGTDALGNTKNFQAADVAIYTLGYASTIGSQTGAYTINYRDLNVFLQYGTNAGVITTLPSTDTTWPVGGEMRIQFTTTGSMSVSAGLGCTLQGSGTLNTQYQVKTLKRISSTVWTIF